MKIVTESMIVDYPADKMYELVCDIEKYPEFLPWCRNAHIMKSSAEEVCATLEVAKGPLHYNFSTKNKLQPGKLIDMQLLDGPFKHLEGFWRFVALNETKTEIVFELEFEFISKLVGFTLEPIFKHITHNIIEAFAKRASELFIHR